MTKLFLLPVDIRDLRLSWIYRLLTKDSEHTGSSTWDTWDNLSLEFQIIEDQSKQVVVEVTISRQEGYWYYGSLDNTIPPIVKTKKKLTIGCEEANSPVAKVGNFIE